MVFVMPAISLVDLATSFTPIRDLTARGHGFILDWFRYCRQMLFNEFFINHLVYFW